MRCVVPVLLLLAACGGVPSARDAGGAGDGGSPDGGLVDAGRGDGGVADAGGSDAGPAEPRHSSAVLFADDFDGYGDTSGLLAAYPDSRQVRAALSLGGGALRVDYAADGGCEDAEAFIAKSFAGDVPALVVTVTFRVSSGFRFVQPASHCGGAGVASAELVLSRLNDAPGQVTLEVREVGAALAWVVRVGALSLAQTAQLDTRAPGALAPEAWHRLTLFLSRESAAGQADGVVRLWVDGRAVLERDGVATGTAPFQRLALPTVLTAGAAATQTRWLDDVAVFTP